MSPRQTNSTEAQADFMAGNPPGQLEMLQRALQHSKANSQEKDRKLCESATAINNLEDSLQKESTRNYELETDQRDKTSEIKELRTLLKKKDHDYALLQQTHRAAEEQSEKDEQNISTLRQTIKKQRDQLESTQREIRGLDKSNGQLQMDLARAQQQTENAYQQGFDDAHSLIKEISTIENPGPWGASEATSAYSSARLSTNPGSSEDNLNYAQSHTSQSQNGSPSHTSDNSPGLTLDQELADLTDGYESPWTGSHRTDANSNTNDDDDDDDHQHHQSASAPEPYQGDSRQIGPPGKSELATKLTATETACKSDSDPAQSEAPSRPHSQPQQFPCTQKPDLSESGVRQEDPGVRMVLMSTLPWSWLSSSWWWWWWWQASGAYILVIMLGYIWWTDKEWQRQQANQSPWSISYDRCIGLGTDSRWLVQQSVLT